MLIIVWHWHMQKGADMNTRTLVKYLFKTFMINCQKFLFTKSPPSLLLLLCHWDESAPCEPVTLLSPSPSLSLSQDSSDQFLNPLKKLGEQLLDNILPVSGSSLFWNHCLEYLFLSNLEKLKVYNWGEKSWLEVKKRRERNYAYSGWLWENKW